jgi:hypothetical protein
MYKIRQIWHGAGKLLTYTKQLFVWLWRKFRTFFLSVWHGSVLWGWFAVLLAGAFGMTSSGEFGGALCVVILSLFSLGSKYWHWAKEKGGTWATTNFCVIPLVLAGIVLSYFWVNDIRGTAAWSHLPKAWKTMLISSTMKIETLPAPACPHPPQTPLDIVNLKSTQVLVSPHSKPLLIPSVDVLYDTEARSFNLFNKGNSNVYLWACLYGDITRMPPQEYLKGKTATITPNGGSYHLYADNFQAAIDALGNLCTSLQSVQYLNKL